MDEYVSEALETIAGGGAVTRRGALRLLETPVEDMLRGADSLREEFFGKTVSLCAVINARSGLCGEDCSFCAQSKRNVTAVVPYRLVESDAIVMGGSAASQMKAERFGIVTSGRRLSELETRKVSAAVRALRRAGEVSPCASLGEIAAETASTLRKAGLSRYHHNLECSERFFPRVCSTHGWRDRLRTVATARAAGFEVCSGGIFGLGESWEDRVDLGIVLREMEVDSVPLNFLVPVRGTRLETRRPLSAREALKIIALFRFILPDREIRVAGGREHVLGEMQHRIFFAGANGMMIGDYLTTRGRRFQDDLRMIERLGFRPVSAPAAELF